MTWIQKEIELSPKPRGFHLVTKEVLKHCPELKKIKVGLAHFFIQHTSASLTVNENADPDVRTDMETHFNEMVPEDASYYTHTLEGSDDITAHIKSTIIGPSVSVPISNGHLNFGTWQGLVLCEHRNHGGSRRLVITLTGETA